jgi:WD40 repeat protein
MRMMRIRMMMGDVSAGLLWTVAVTSSIDSHLRFWNFHTGAKLGDNEMPAGKWWWYGAPLMMSPRLTTRTAMRMMMMTVVVMMVSMLMLLLLLLLLLRLMVMMMTGDIWTVAWHPKENLLASGCQDGKVNLYKMEKGAAIKEGELEPATNEDKKGRFILSVAFVSLVQSRCGQADVVEGGSVESDTAS